jgi:hypothetical protein
MKGICNIPLLLFTLSRVIHSDLASFFSEKYSFLIVTRQYFCISHPNAAMDLSSTSQQSTDSQKSLGTSTEDDIEMVSQLDGSPQDSQDDAVVAEDGTKLPRAGGGRDAWLFLVGCFVFEALVWGIWHLYELEVQFVNVLAGFPFSFGVFESYYTNNLSFLKHLNGILMIGTFLSGGMYLLALLTLYILDLWPSIYRLSSIFWSHCRSCGSCRIKLPYTSLGFHSHTRLPIGGTFLYALMMFYFDEWFIFRKGLAFGIMWAGVGTVG